jgi:septal ring factor EnvC (AmiA/AmiB activator)
MEREEYIDEMAAKLKDWNAEVEKLEAKAREASAEAKKEINKEVEIFRAKKQKAEHKLDNLKKAGEDSWKELQAETKNAFEDIKGTLDNAVRRFENI